MLHHLYTYGFNKCAVMNKECNGDTQRCTLTELIIGSCHWVRWASHWSWGWLSHL